MTERVRLCVAHRAPIYEDSHGRLCCEKGCFNVRKFHTAVAGRIEATVTECRHAGRRGKHSRVCPICGVVIPEVRSNNHFEEELAECESSAVVWA